MRSGASRPSAARCLRGRDTLGVMNLIVRREGGSHLGTRVPHGQGVQEGIDGRDDAGGSGTLTRGPNADSADLDGDDGPGFEFPAILHQQGDARSRLL